MYQQLKEHIEQYVQLTEEEYGLIEQKMFVKEVPKKTMLLRLGEICKYEYFILKGCVKCYYIDEEGFEVIISIPFENWWVSDIKSFHEKLPSKIFIETVEDSELLYLSLQNKEALFAAIPQLEKFFRILVQRNLSEYQDRLYGQLCLTAQERYLIFLHKYPILNQRISQKLIATYLGISPEFLSKIRSRIAHGG